MANGLNITQEMITGMSFEVNGKREHFDSFYDDASIPNCGAIYGLDEVTNRRGVVRCFDMTKCVYALSAFRRNEDGSIFGIQGLFKNGTWDTDENGDPLYRVWDRII